MGVILHKAKGQTVPTELLEKIVKNNQSGRGGVMFYDGKLELFTDRKPADLKTVQETLEAFKECPILLSFNDFQGDFLEDDLQPFTLLKDGEDILLVGCLQGDLTHHRKEGGKHTDEFFAVYSYLIPLLNEEFNENGQDLEKLFQKFERTTFKTTLMGLSGNHHTLVMMAPDGTMYDFSKNDGRTVFPWGWTTKAYATEPVAVTEKTVAANDNEPSRLSKLNRFLGKKAPVISPEAEKTVVHANPTAVPTVTTIQDLNGSVKDTRPKTKMFYPPVNIQSKNDRRKWYEDRLGAGNAPMGYNKARGIAIPLPIDAEGNEIKPVKAVLKTLADLPKEPEKPVVEAPTTESVKEEPAEILPIMPNKDKKEIADSVHKGKLKELSDMSGNTVPDPTALAELRKKIPLFSEQVGLEGMPQTFSWSHAVRRQLGKDNPEGLAVLCTNYLHMLLLEMAKNVKQEEPEKTETLSTQETAVVEKRRRFAM